jgi:N-formylglutamate amidohydrolase
MARLTPIETHAIKMAVKSSLYMRQSHKLPLTFVRGYRCGIRAVVETLAMAKHLHRSNKIIDTIINKKSPHAKNS